MGQGGDSDSVGLSHITYFVSRGKSLSAGFKEKAVKTLLRDFEVSQHLKLNFVFDWIYLGLRVKF